MKLWQRVLVTVVITLAVIFVAVNWVAPVALSYYAARKAPAVTRIVPTELKDKSISNAPGMKVSYFGYEFEAPWNDLDDSQTKLYPTNAAAKNMAVLHFRSGLALMVKAIPPQEWINKFSISWNLSQSSIAEAFKRKGIKSDYDFVRTVYEFTPDRMHLWALSQRLHSTEEFLLSMKSATPLKSAETGIFRIENQDFKGFQQGDPGSHQDGIVVDLYSDQGSVEIIFLQKDFHNPGGGVTQPEINGIVASMRRASPDMTAASMN